MKPIGQVSIIHTVHPHDLLGHRGRLGYSQVTTSIGFPFYFCTSFCPSLGTAGVHSERRPLPYGVYHETANIHSLFRKKKKKKVPVLIFL